MANMSGISSTLFSRGVFYLTLGVCKEQNKIVWRPVRHVSMKTEAMDAGEVAM